MPGGTLRQLALAEAATLLALVFVAVPLKHVAGLAEASRVFGPIHGQRPSSPSRGPWFRPGRGCVGLWITGRGRAVRSSRSPPQIIDR
jgi:hypothetical protein